jgi:hypothetical protein
MAEKQKKDKKWIQKAIDRPGAFTAKAKKRGIKNSKTSKLTKNTCRIA